MTQLLKTCSEMTENKIETHQWVRVKAGDYKDDLGLVETVEGNNKAWVRLIPRNRQPVQKSEEDNFGEERPDFNNAFSEQ